jgi:WASH complex subunit strumpellin
MDKIKEFETKVNKDHLKDYANLDERFMLAKITHEVTIFTEGMLCLDQVLMGVITIEPKEILIYGIRKEMLKSLAKTLHSNFIFKQ